MSKINELTNQGALFGDVIESKDVESIEYLQKSLVEHQKKLINATAKIEKINNNIKKIRLSIGSIKSKYSKESII